ncbi:MAG: type IV pilus modification protein PilV [Gammaproteobacteria bacterium]|nr:type IV pilus modification protein PilV [Gammaproteobacteria bacterium]
MQLIANSNPKGKRTAGFTIIEVLIAVVIMALGLLGLARLQTLGITSSGNAYYYTQAIYLANDIADRMRSNQPGIDSGNYDGVEKATDCFTTDTGCADAEAAAKADYTNWCAALANTLPSGTGVVTFSSGEHQDCSGGSFATTSNIPTITIMWDNDRTGGTGRGCSTDTSVDLTCYQVTLSL